MPRHLTLYADFPGVPSLRALRNLRSALARSPKAELIWQVVDVNEPTRAAGDRPPAAPALHVLGDGVDGWLQGDPAAAIPPESLTGAAGLLSAPHFLAGSASPETAGPAAVWRQVLRATPGGCALFLGDGWLVYANEPFRRTYGLAPGAELGRRPDEWCVGPAEALAPVRSAAEGDHPFGALRLVQADAELRLAVLYAAPPPQAALALLEEIRTTNHAIGNALVGILGYGELLQRDLTLENQTARSRAKSITDAAQRIDELSQQLSANIRRYLGLPPKNSV